MRGEAYTAMISLLFSFSNSSIFNFVIASMNLFTSLERQSNIFILLYILCFETLIFGPSLTQNQSILLLQCLDKLGQKSLLFQIYIPLFNSFYLLITNSQQMFLFIISFKYLIYSRFLGTEVKMICILIEVAYRFGSSANRVFSICEFMRMIDDYRYSFSIEMTIF